MTILPLNNHVLIQKVEDTNTLVSVCNVYSKYNKGIVVDVCPNVSNITVGDTVLIEGYAYNDTCVDTFCTSQGMYLISKDFIVGKVTNERKN